MPLEIIKKPPTAGLWAGQTDEEELGIKYEILDKILYLMVDKNLDDNEIAQKLKIPINEVLRIKIRINNSQHKLEPAQSPGSVSYTHLIFSVIFIFPKAANCFSLAWRYIQYTARRCNLHSKK